MFFLSTMRSFFMFFFIVDDYAPRTNFLLEIVSTITIIVNITIVTMVLLGNMQGHILTINDTIVLLGSSILNK